MGFFFKSKEEKLLAAAKSGNVTACRAALDEGADKKCKDGRVRALRWPARAPCLARRTRQPRRARAESRTRPAHARGAAPLALQLPAAWQRAPLRVGGGAARPALLPPLLRPRPRRMAR
jgi:hypothetical protein